MEIDRRATDANPAPDGEFIGIDRLVSQLSRTAEGGGNIGADSLQYWLWNDPPLERWLMLASLFAAVASVVATLSALRDSWPFAARALDFASRNEPVLQAVLLITAFAWFAYAWFNYRQMRRARNLILKAELVDLWLRTRQTDK